MLNTASEVNMLTMLAVIKINENDDKKKKKTQVVKVEVLVLSTVQVSC